MTEAESRYVHGTAVAVGTRGVLIRGDSGSGKSRLAARLTSEAHRRKWFAALVGDDRVELDARGPRLIARGHPAIAGLIEHRGEGLVATPCEAACVIDCLIDLSTATTVRFPEPGRDAVELLGLSLPRITLPAGLRDVDYDRLLDRIALA